MAPLTQLSGCPEACFLRLSSQICPPFFRLRVPDMEIPIHDVTNHKLFQCWYDTPGGTFHTWTSVTDCSINVGTLKTLPRIAFRVCGRRIRAQINLGFISRWFIIYSGVPKSENNLEFEMLLAPHISDKPCLASVFLFAQ